jgi:hypothetical protein
MVLLADHDLDVGGMERQLVPTAHLLHPVDKERVPAASHAAVRLLDVDVVPFEAVELQVAHLPRPPADAQGELDVVAPGPGHEQIEMGLVHQMEEHGLGQGVLGAPLQLTVGVVALGERGHVALKKVQVSGLVFSQPRPRCSLGVPARDTGPRRSSCSSAAWIWNVASATGVVQADSPVSSQRAVPLCA